MGRAFAFLRQFFSREDLVSPFVAGLLPGGVNGAARNELFFAELMDDKWDGASRRRQRGPQG